LGGEQELNSTAKLSVRNVRKVFNDRKQEVVAIDDLSFDLDENEFATLVGTSGCGKSTLLSIVGGLEEQTAGEVLVDGTPVTGPGRDRGVVFQTYTLFPWLSVLDNIQFALRGDLTRKERRRVALEHIELVGLEHFAHAMPNQLSGGMRQRVAIARALCYRPKVLLMDEPFGALDAQTRQLMQELLTSIWEQHKLTVLFVTHDIEEAVFLSDRVFLMTARPGRLKDVVPVDLARPRTFELLGTPEFHAYETRLLASVRQESLKSLEA
jgi:NitT/TauT family transport system ATP-binding protein